MFDEMRVVTIPKIPTIDALVKFLGENAEKEDQMILLPSAMARGLVVDFNKVFQFMIVKTRQERARKQITKN